jgi:predicted transcriptional regulator
MTLPFGPLLKQLRKQAGMTQRDLAAALGYSESLICNLEKAQRQPDLQAVAERFGSSSMPPPSTSQKSSSR